MDAIVFFAVCSVICASMMSYALSQPSVMDETGPREDLVDELLAVFLEASFGERMCAGLSELELVGTERFCDVLRLTLVLILRGCVIEDFSAILAHCATTLSSMCLPWLWSLELSASTAPGWREVAEFGGPVHECADAWSASQELGTSDGAALRATLVLTSEVALRGT